jgi:hypothetical protein
MSRHNRLKYHEIADEMEISRETVKKYLQIATTSIKDYVHEHMEAISIGYGDDPLFSFFLKSDTPFFNKVGVMYMSSPQTQVANYTTNTEKHLYERTLR